MLGNSNFGSSGTKISDVIREGLHTFIWLLTLPQLLWLPKLSLYLCYCGYATAPELFTMRIFSVLFIYTLTHFLLSVSLISSCFTFLFSFIFLSHYIYCPYFSPSSHTRCLRIYILAGCSACNLFTEHIMVLYPFHLLHKSATVEGNTSSFAWGVRFALLQCSCVREVAARSRRHVLQSHKGT